MSYIMEKTEIYADQVRTYLQENGDISTKPAIKSGTDVPDWYLRQMTASGGEFYSSPNHNQQYVASKYTVGRRAGPNGFWRPAVDDGAAVFHTEGTTKDTLKYLAFNRPSGLTAAEAADLLGRPCYRALDRLVADNAVTAVDCGDTTVYAHTWEHRRSNQLTERTTDTQIDLNPPAEPADEADFIFCEEILDEVAPTAEEHIHNTSMNRATALLLRPLMDDSFEGIATRLRRNWRLRDAIEYAEPSDVPSGTTLWRAFRDIDPAELKACLQDLIDELLADEDQAGQFAVIDATHIHAWADTRGEIEDGEVEGASWGHHEGSFYGYKLFLVVDSALELPVAALLATGKRNDQAMFEPLIEDFDERYETSDLEAMFADAGFDSQANRKSCQEVLDCPLMTVINPRRSTPLQGLKEEIKSVFKEHGDEIECVDDALDLLPQTLLSDFGVELGNDEHSYIVHAVKERMNRHLRAGVERVIGRLKEFAGVADPRVRQLGNVRTHVLLSVLSLVATAVTAKRRGKPSLMLSPSRIM